MTLQEKIGQRLMTGFPGLEMTEEFIQVVKEHKIGNVILFRENIRDNEQLKKLCDQIQTLIRAETGHSAFIAIDQEGGIVTRLKEDGVNVPGAMALGATGDPENAHKAGLLIGREMRALGPNFNFAPTVDVNANRGNPVIGVRSFSDDPQKAALFGEAAVRAYENSGIYCCGKHFPGHGDTNVDSHLGLPVIEKTIEELEEAELIPFRRCIEAGIPAIMSSHILFPKIEPENVPGTMSRRIITGLLKEKLGFRGLVFSDCLEMAAIQKYYGTAKGTVAAFKAGVDLAELSSRIDLMRETAQAVNEAADRGEFDMEEIKASVEKILAFKKNMVTVPEKELCNRPEDRETVKHMIRGAITCCQGIPPVPDENTFFCGCGDYRASLVGNPELQAPPFPEYMAAIFGGAAMVTAKNPGEEEIRTAARRASGYQRIVLGTCNAHLSPGQLELARALADTGKELTVVALRSPYDIPLLPDCACKIVAYEYSEPAFDALAEVFRGGAVTGRLPVK